MKKSMRNKFCYTTLSVVLLTFILMLYVPIASATVYSGNIVLGSGGVTSYSSNYYYYGNVFEGTGMWANVWNDPNPWLQYEFLTPRTVTKFHMEGDQDYRAVPLTFDFEAYNESTQSWDILKSVTTAPGTNWFETTVDNTIAYKKYRISNITWAGDYDRGITLFELYETIYPPIAQNVNVTTEKDTAKQITLTADNPNNYSLTYTIVSIPTHGTLGTVSGDKVTYTPNPGYYGTDSFTYKVSGGGQTSNTATVSITVTTYSGNIVLGSGGVTSYSSNYYYYGNVFEGTGMWANVWNDPNPWLQYEFPTPRTVTKFHMEGDQDYRAVPLTFDFEAYNESTQSWDILKSVTTAPGTNWFETTVDNTKAYKKYRISNITWAGDYDRGITLFELYETIY